MAKVAVQAAFTTPGSITKAIDWQAHNNIEIIIHLKNKNHVAI